MHFNFGWMNGRMNARRIMFSPLYHSVTESGQNLFHTMCTRMLSILRAGDRENHPDVRRVYSVHAVCLRTEQEGDEMERAPTHPWGIPK